MGEGFIQQLEENKQANEIGGRYFRELVSRSIFQASSNHSSQFVMHDLVHELAQWASGETCFRLEYASDEQHKRIERARHSSYSPNTCDGFKRFEVFYEVKGLRTFLPLSQHYYDGYLTNSVLFDLLPKLKNLRVLSLARYNITELSDSIGDLKYLRYLNLSRTKIRGLLELTCSLYNLQSLILSYCYHLKKLPLEMENLVNLCHLDITHTFSLEAMPIGLKELKSLQTLSHFVVAKDSGCRIKELINFRSVCGRMCISNLENVIDVKDAEEANLDEKYLDVVELRWSYNFDDSRNVETEKHVLDMLRPHQNLKELTIKCFGGSGFPTWIGDPSFFSIGLLILENCKNCTYLPPLGQLSSLKKLVIEGMVGIQNVGTEFCGSSCSKPFPLLEVLSFKDMQEWENWGGFEVNEQVKVFSCLRELSIINCPKLLGNLPNNLVSLEKLIIRRCGNLEVSISSLPKLCILDIYGCQGITCGSTIESTKVEYIMFGGDGCEESITINLPPTVIHLELSDFGRLGRLPMTFCSLMHLRRLYIDGCSSLVSLLRTILLAPVLDGIYIYNCKNLHTLLDDGQEYINFGCLSASTIKRLSISICPSVEFVARILPNSLAHLNIYDCSRLKFIVETFLDNPRLESICISNCENLQSFPKGLHKLSLLNELRLYSCPNFISFAEEGLPSTNLRHLAISDCEKLEALPNGIHNLPSLQQLTIWNCPALVFVPQEGFLTNLILLRVSGVNICRPLLEWGLHRLSSLKILTISSGCAEVEAIGMTLPLSLTELTIEDFPNLKRLSSNCFQNLTSLRDLCFVNCPKLKCLPKEGLPPSLLQLSINLCPLLKIQCRRYKGKDWSKIAHIPCVEIDLKFIYEPES